MRRSRSSYSGYRGRRTINDILRLIAIVLAVLVAVMIVSLFLGQSYIVFTDSGLRLDLPFLQKMSPAPVDSGSISVVVQPSSSEPEEPVQLPEKEQSEMLALQLPLGSILDDTAAQKLKQAGANALILNMKDENGQLGWVSRQDLAVQAGVNSKEAGVNEAMEAWNEGEVYTVARVCCFRDNTVPYQRNDVALRAGYGNWRDEQKMRWLNPDSADARAYLIGLCEELAELGFDEILLDCCGFPTQGKVNAIVKNGSYKSGQFSQTVETFLNEVYRALEPYGTVLSLRVQRAVLTGEDTGSGLTAVGLEKFAGRVWMAEDAEEPSLVDLLAGAGVAQSEKRLVVVTDFLSGEEKNAQAVFDGV